MDSALPSPTSDREKARRDLAVHGYCVWRNALMRPELQALHARLGAQAAGEDAIGAGFHDGEANQRVWMLVNKGQVFRDLVLHPIVADFMGELLGQSFLLSSLTANIARPGGVPMYLHSDQGYVDFWTPKPLVANIAWMLDAFTEENGGTRIVPGSHLKPVQPYKPEETVAAVGPAGSALIFDGRVVHGTGENRTVDAHRHAILSYFCRPFVRQQENFFLGLDPNVCTDASPAFLARLGYTIWAGLGRTASPGRTGVIRPGEELIGSLGADGHEAV